MPLWLIIVIIIVVILLIITVPELLIVAILAIVGFLGYHGVSALLMLTSAQEVHIIYIFKDLDSSEDALQFQIAVPAHWSRWEEEIIEFETLVAPTSMMSETMSIKLQGIGPLSVPTSTLELPLQPNNVVTQTASYRPGWLPSPSAHMQVHISLPGYKTFVTEISVEAYGDWR